MSLTTPHHFLYHVLSSPSLFVPVPRDTSVKQHRETCVYIACCDGMCVCTTLGWSPNPQSDGISMEVRPLCHKGGAFLIGLLPLKAKTQANSLTLFLPYENTIRKQPSANQKGGPHKTQDLPAPLAPRSVRNKCHLSCPAYGKLLLQPKQRHCQDWRQKRENKNTGFWMGSNSGSATYEFCAFGQGWLSLCLGLPVCKMGMMSVLLG
jgi:hypothetical protein